mmetsp:Transcript_19062/g.37415  ORF Transcript_19062/g.37415 Transcript_19062/m.37415 type:complete len:344 (-) Transcript_19062:1794-2825(-)|eukprot:CAMPEP_0171484506 /NCGR_PEP_ID=MMETSP0958-20121227/39_1 /TAXON_ID=87120 /ORGANISM="Aurantiochytrium limacinum, Strain ATCCMYA-1381" /LENGTH=343 /DNA_ID=CAMNT_0012017215 /DNA_START=23 /DNA_END=1054 /DNA_ORIENTATION=-
MTKVASLLAVIMAVLMVAMTPTEARMGGLRESFSIEPQEMTLGAKSCKVINDRPIIGVLSQPNDDGPGEYVAASYVKNLEMAGARVVPVRYTSSEKELRRIFESVNGLFFPGGSAYLSHGHPYFDASEKLFHWALEANANGQVYPIWGTCLGFEQLAVLASGSNATVLDASGIFDSEDYSAPVTLTANAEDSELVGTMPARLRDAMIAEDITFNAHGQGVSPDVFAGNPALSGFFTNLATYVDKKGKPFVAMFEAKNNIPIYGVQFHPEKAIFEFYVPSNIPHSPDAVFLAQYFTNFFVLKTRCNDNKFAGGLEQEAKEVIQAQASHHSVHYDQYFAETYEFY